MPRAYNSDAKKPFSVSLRPSRVNRARSLGIDINLICDQAIDLATGKDPEEIEMRGLEKELSLLRAEIGAKEARYNQLKEIVDRKASLRLEARLEEDCGAWYLRMLIHENSVFASTPAKLDVRSLFQNYSREFPDFQGARLDGDTIILRERPGRKVYGMLKARGFRFMNSTTCTYVSPDPVLHPTTQERLNRLKIDLDEKALLSDLVSGRVSGSLPVRFFAVYSPRIVDPEVKREIKARMTPDYMRPDLETEAIR